MKLNKADKCVLGVVCVSVVLSILLAILCSVLFSAKIVAQSSVREQYVGDNIGMFVKATGSHLAYQWRKEGVDINGAVSPTFMITTASLEDAGTYTCVVTGRWNRVVSADIAVKIFVPETTTKAAMPK